MTRCSCGSPSSDGCAELGYCTGPRASAHDRDLAEADRAYLRRLYPDHRTVEQTIADAAQVHAALRDRAAHDAAAEVARIARDQAQHTRWCSSCETDVFPVYPSERRCVRCRLAFESEIELELAAE